MSVQVAVRVRPFNEKELKAGAKCCIEMSGETTVITDVETGKTRNFTFNYSFWSHDGFKTSPEGMYVPDGNKYADQRKVYNALGKAVLDNAWQGYHCCLFAYGQTGSGKSYSMDKIGYPPNKGIVPIATDEIFQRIKATSSETKKYEITVSMLEIYNERVQDLLINPDDRPAGGLKVRESKAIGVFVDKLSKHPVNSYEDIASKMEEGNKNRTIGETLMNQTSSRAHTIITIEFKQIDISGGKKSEKFSMINLVDLAGSEKAGQTGATGDRLKEGCAINKSLTVLGQVISTLADKACGKAKKEVVPYRDSVLTRILQNALGGNSKTIMICALSPSSTNYEETLSTLRYAERAKKIENKAVINESPQERMIRELKEENEKLKAMLSKISASGGLNDPEGLKKVEELQEELTANMIAMGEMEKTWQEKVEEAKKMAETHGPVVHFDKTKPHIYNLHEDLQLNGKVVHNIIEENVHVGRKDGTPKPQIVLGGIGIKNNHAIFTRRENEDVYLAPFDATCAEMIFVNGVEIKGPTKLTHKDRIIFGSNVVFLFCYPGRESESKIPLDQEVDWEMAQKEKMNITEKVQKEMQEMLQRKHNEESERKIKEVEIKYLEEKKRVETEMSKLKTEYESKLKNFQEKEATSSAKVIQLEDTKKELEDLKDKLNDMQKAIEQSETEMKLEIENEARLEEKRKKNLAEKQHMLLTLGYKINEAQTLAKDLGRNIRFEPRIITKYPEIHHTHPLQILKECTFDLLIQVINGEDGTSYMWSEDKFTDRLYIMKDMYNTFVQCGELTLPEKESDPFWDENEPIFIGMGFYMLKGLGYMIDNPVDISLIGNLYEHTGGKLYMNILPVDANGDRDIPPEYIPENPYNLINSKMNLLVEIKEAKDLPETCCKDVFCEYKFYLDEEKYRTEIAKGRNRNPMFNYSRLHTMDVVTENFVNYLLGDFVLFWLCVKVYGYINTMEIGRPKTLKKEDQLARKSRYSTKAGEYKKEDRKGCTVF